MKLALGFNPEIFYYKQIDERVKLIELGLFEYSHFKKKQKKTLIPFSLHLGRAPIVENIKLQAEYLDYLETFINPEDFISFGFHLINERYLGIGQFGFSSHYSPSSSKESNAISFLSEIKKRFKVETWLENANFYSADFLEIKSAYKSLNYIAEKSNSKLIVDLSHIIIDFTNAKIAPELSIGLIDWKKVCEIHLSGINEDKNGILHDCHSRKVDNRVWSLLEKIFPLLNDDIFLNLEHTDPVLAKGNIEEEIDLLFHKTSKFQSKEKTSHNLNNYIESYFCKLFPRWIIGVEDALKDERKNLRESVSQWIEYCKDNSIKIALNEFEILSSEKNKVFSAPIHFLSFIQGNEK